MRREDRQGVGAAGTERAQYRLVHGAALPQSAGTGSVPGPAAVAVLHLAAPPRLLRRHVARLFAAHAVALATSEAPPTRRPPPAPRAPAPPRVPAPAAARTAPPAGDGLPRLGAIPCLFSGFRCDLSRMVFLASAKSAYLEFVSARDFRCVWLEEKKFKLEF